jgi:hypothetical protein
MRRRYLRWIVMAVLLGGCVAPRPPGLSSTAQPPRAEPSQTWDAPPSAPLPGSLAYLDFTNGFRDLTFGDEPTPDMQLTERKGDTTLYPSQRPCARCGSHLPLGLLIWTFFGIIAQIRILYVENFGSMASGRRRPEHDFCPGAR